MGVQDRDWWRDRFNKRAGSRNDPMNAVYSPKLFRGGSVPSSPGEARQSVGWFSQVLVWVAVLGAVFMAFKFFEQRSYVSLLERQMAEQHRLIQQQKKEIEALRPKPRVDFFK